jgi:hypothetical protein
MQIPYTAQATATGGRLSTPSGCSHRHLPAFPVGILLSMNWPNTYFQQHFVQKGLSTAFSYSFFVRLTAELAVSLRCQLNNPVKTAMVSKCDKNRTS